MKAKEKLNNIWVKIDGKKTWIGIGLHAVWLGAGIFSNGKINERQQVTGHALIFQITGVGIGHKFVKSALGKKAIQFAKKLIFK